MKSYRTTKESIVSVSGSSKKRSFVTERSVFLFWAFLCIIVLYLQFPATLYGIEHKYLSAEVEYGYHFHQCTGLDAFYTDFAGRFVDVVLDIDINNKFWKFYTVYSVSPSYCEDWIVLSEESSNPNILKGTYNFQRSIEDGDFLQTDAAIVNLILNKTTNKGIITIDSESDANQIHWIMGWFCYGVVQEREFVSKEFFIEPEDKPIITKQSCEYEGLFIENIDVENQYSVEVDWQGTTPGTIEFDLNGKIYTVTATETGGSYNFDMGSDFIPNAQVLGNALEVVAISDSGARSDPVEFNPIVVPCPIWLTPFTNFGTFSPDPPRNIYDFAYPEKPFKATVAVPDFIPVFGGETGLTNSQIKIKETFHLSGLGEFEVGGESGFVIAGKKAAISIAGNGSCKYTPGEGFDLISLGARLGLDITLSEKSKPLLSLIPGLGALTYIPGIKHIVKKAVVGYELPVNFSLGISFIDIVDGLAFENTEANATIPAKVFAKTDFDDVKLELFASGILASTFQFPENPGYLKELSAVLEAGLEIQFFLFSYKPTVKHKWSYPSKSSFFRTSLDNMDISPQPVKPEFIKYGPYMRPVNSRSESLASNPQIETILENVYRYCEPSVSETDGLTMLTFVSYDVNDPLLQNTEIYYTKNDGSGFTPPQPILNDTRADFAPQVAITFNASDIVANNDKAVAVWQRVKDENFPEDGDLTTMLADLEIVFSVYDPGTGVWTVPVEITDNNHLDHHPILKRNNNGELLLVWESNTGNELFATPESPSTIQFCIWDGSNWSSPATVMNNVVGAYDLDNAFWAEGAMLVWSQDNDLDPDTDTDQEICFSFFERNTSTWSVPVQLTDDNIADDRPRVVCKQASGPLDLLWRHGENIVQLTDLVGGQFQNVRFDEANDSGIMNYRIASDSSNRLVMTWLCQDQDGPNIYYRAYDRENNCWSYDKRFTDDLAMEKIGQPVFSNSDALLLAYDSAEIELVSKTIEVDGENFTIDEYAQQGRNDLKLLTYNLEKDLGFISNSLTFDPDPVPDEQTTITASVCNLGDFTIESVKFAFYDGDPNNGGTIIGTIQEVPGGLDSGDIYDVSVSWQVPDDNQSHTVYAVVDPEGTITESDESNNQIESSILQPDLQIVSAIARANRFGSIDLEATITNTGQTLAMNFAVDFCLNSSSGTQLASKNVLFVQGGSTIQVALDWEGDGSMISAGVDRVVVVVDPADNVEESNENDNEAPINFVIGVAGAEVAKPIYVSKDINSEKSPHFTTIQAAMDSITENSNVLIAANIYDEDLEIDISVPASLDCGYDEGFNNKTGDVILNGCLTINSGGLTINGLTIGCCQ
ncbi:MAG: hypothetical protein JXR80_02415 [Deltaproteobacteria bacterium]|nr:hypothetical protein [Deltaproteobacteria bacterium]